MTDITPSRYTSLTSIDVTMPVLTDNTLYSVDVTNSSGVGSGAFTIGTIAPVGSMKTNIRAKIEALILAMRTADGYNFDWLSNNRDLTLSTFPNFYVRFLDETSLDFDSGETNFQSYDNVVDVELWVTTANSNSGYDPQRINEDQLDLAEDDIKKLFADSGQQGSGLGAEGATSFMYASSSTNYFETNDIFTPENRIFKFRLQYTQDRLNPEQIAC